MKDAIIFTCSHLELLCLSLRQALQNEVESIDVVASKSDHRNSTVWTRSLVEIAVALDSLLGTGMSNGAENLAKTTV